MSEIKKDEELLKIVDYLKEYDVKLRGLYGLYNTLLLDAEENRSNLSTYYEEMIDLKNSLNSISQIIYGSKKSERDSVYSRKKSEIKKLNSEADKTNEEFIDSSKKYCSALKECGSLKTEYKHKIINLRKEFKAAVQKETPQMVIKLFVRQVKSLNKTLENIEKLISDYNVKRNQVEENSKRFNDLYQSVLDLLERLKVPA